MRKDVKLGFGLGGVLLAVIIVAVLVFHRNKNTAKTVAFDPGSGAAVTPVSDPGTPGGSAVSTPDGAAGVSVPAAQPDAESRAAAPAPKPLTGESADKGSDRWDALFASTASDPIKTQLTTSTPTKPRAAHKSEPAPEARTEAVANTQIDAGSSTETVRPTPRTSIAAEPRNETQTARTHKVQSGETFTSISKTVYGTIRYYKAIEDANPGVSPEKLRPGMEIQIPSLEHAKQSGNSTRSSSAEPGPSHTRTASGGKTYTIQKNDSLYSISRKLYGRGDKAEAIYDLNRQVIGPDSTKLKIGMVLQLPEPATATASR